MKVLVTEMPREPKDCLFSVDPRCGFYVYTLREYIPEADEKDIGYKPTCVCKDCSKCSKLEVQNDRNGGSNCNEN